MSNSRFEKIQRPVTLQIRPANKGLNVSETPQNIDIKESPSMMNIRFNHGQIQFRTGFSHKYPGCKEAPMWLDTVYSQGYTALVAFTRNHIYALSGSDVFEVIDIYDGAGIGTKLPYPGLSLDPTQHWFSIDVGAGTYGFEDANGGAEWPLVSDYDDLMIVVDGTGDGIYVVAYTGVGTNVEAEVLTVKTDAPSSARCVAIFDNRLVFAHINDEPSAIQWSSKGDFDNFTATDSDKQTIGDSPDWIMVLKKLGNYLIVYKERSIYLGRVTNISSPALAFEPAPGQGIGLAAPNSVGDLGEEHIFLGWDDVYIFSLKNLDTIGTRIKDDLFYGDFGILPKYLGNCQGVIAEEFDEYWLFVPTGRWPEDTEYTGDGPENSVENLVTNSMFYDDDSDTVPDDWTAAQDGDGTFTTQSGGTLGEKVGRLAFSTGTYVQATSTTFDFDEVIHGDTISIVIWAKASDAATLTLKPYTLDSAGANETAQDTHAIALTTTMTRYVFSFSIDDADAEQLKLVLYTATSGVNVDIDAVHMIRLDGIDESYIVGSTGSLDVGYLGPYAETPQTIPFIADRIGQWMCDTVWVYNYSKNAWSCWRLPVTGFGYDSIQRILTIGSLEGTISEQTWRYDEKRIQEFAPTNLIGTPDAQVYEIAQGITEDFGGVLDRPILAFWESKDIDLDAPYLDKTFSRLIIYHETTHAAHEITVSVSTDSGVTVADEQVVNINTGSTFTIVDFFVTGSQLRFSVRSTTYGFFISGFSVKLIPRGEIHAY